MKRILFVAIIINSCIVCFANENPGAKKKPDTMLFGDVFTGKNEHIPFATISIDNGTFGTVSDESGHYKLTGVPVGHHIVEISAIGYMTARFEITLKEAEPVVLKAELKPDQIGIEQIVVSGDRNNKSRRNVATIVSAIGPKLMDVTQSITLSEGLNYIPGLRMENNCQNCGFTQIRMNGLEGPYSQILINSRPVFSGLAGVYGLELIPSNMIDRIEVVRGGGSALFGGSAIAGTINLITKEPISNIYSVSTNMGIIESGTLDYNLNLNTSVLSDNRRTGMSLYGFKRNRGFWDANNDGFSEISELENNTFGTSFFHRTSTRGKFGVDYFYINESRRGGSLSDKLFHEVEVAEAVEHKINSVSAMFDQFFRNHDKLSAYFAIQSVNRDSYYGADFDPSAYGNTKDLSYNAGTQYHRDIDNFLIGKSELLLGLETTGTALNDKKKGYYSFDLKQYLDDTVIAKQSVSTYGLFAQNEWNWNKFKLGLGLRYEHYNVEDKKDASDTSGNVLSPRITALWTIHPKIQLRGSYANGYRAPQIFDEDLHVETSIARQVTHVNDPNLQQETSNSYTLSVDYVEQFGNITTQFLIEGFYTKLNNPFVNEYGEADENGNVIYTRKNADDGATVKGVNIEANATLANKLLLQLGMTLQASKYETAQEFNEIKFFRTPNTYGYFTFTYSPTVKFRASLTGNYTGKMLIPYFGNTLPDPEIGELRTSTSFFDVGMKISYDFRLAENCNIQIFGGIKNIFNSYQEDFDNGANRDPGYIYGPLTPQMFYIGVKLGNVL